MVWAFGGRRVRRIQRWGRIERISSGEGSREGRE